MHKNHKRFLTGIGLVLYFFVVGYTSYTLAKKVLADNKTTATLKRDVADMTDEEVEIFNYLLENPGMLNITADGRNMYMLLESNLGENAMMLFSGPDFNAMSPHKLNEWLENTLTELGMERKDWD